MSKPLADKVALVTGASRGIGAAIAQRLATDGAAVALSYASSPAQAEKVVQQIEAGGGRAIAIQADQADATQVTQLVREVHRRFGRLDILVNSAGVFMTGEVGDAAADVAAVVDRQLAVNVRGLVAAVRAAAPLLPDGGRVVNIGSLNAASSPFPGLGDYSATKAAVAAYTRAWARDLGPRGITVNVVQPGPVDTAMNPADGSEFAERLRRMTALGRYGRPGEIAAAVAFLAGPEATYITGATLNVDGGQLT